MKKLISIVLCLAVLFSCFATFSASADTQAQTLSKKLIDTSDFSLSSIELTEQMLIGYNIGNCFEMTELRPNYVRPECSNMDELIYHKETMAGNVAVTEDYIKYLKSVGIQAIRLPVTWFNMLEDENGNIYPKDTWYGDLATRREAWYNGKINEEFLARVKQVVDWIIENDMYCIINTHHDASCNNANSILPIKMDEANKEQTYNYFTNIWSQVGEHFKDYGSKLLFEFFNEASDSSGSMTQTDQRSAFVAELLTYLIPLIRNQGSNNTNRFLVCPAYGGVSFWRNIDGFKDSDTADDKLIITTHKYESASSIRNAVSSARSKMNNLGVGAIIDEIGHSWSGTISEDYITLAQNLRKASDEYKVSCFFWDNGDYDFTLVNRHYCTPSTPALSAYVGKDLEYKTYTKEEVINLTKSDQPNWVEVYTPDAKNIVGKKYLIIASEKKIKTFDTVKAGAGYYVHSGAENGLVTYFDSDDGVNYTIRNTVIQTNWTKMAWGTFHVYGSTFKTDQIGGNYKIEKIGEGLQGYVTTGENLILQGGNWRKGHYSTSGNYEGEGTTYYNQRISLENKIQVTPGAYYLFSISETQTRYKLIIRAYNENGNFVSNLGTVDAGAIQAPNSAHYFSISIYDSKGSEGAEKQLSLLADGTLNPTMYLYVDAEELECKHTPIENSGVVTKPTCKAEGYTEYTCIKCGEKYKQDFVAITSEHTPVLDQAIEPTCTKSGLKEGSHCAICDKVLVSQQTVDALGHIEVVDKGYSATCTEKGLTDGLHCDRDGCKAVLVKQQEIDALGHKEVVTIKGIAPTCTLSGVLDEIKCETCKITLQKRAFAPAKGHEYKEMVTKEPTCGKDGVKTYKCECGHSYTESIPKTNAHKYVWKVTKKSTYFANGTKSYKCSCGKVAKTTTIKKLVLKKPTVKYTAGKKQIAVKYTKVTGATGFQVRYRLTTTKKWKTVYFKTAKSATKYIKSLTKNKKYYLQTRAYVQSGSKKAYSSWTTTKTIKVK